MKNAFAAHPFLFALFPPLFLFSHNVGQVSLEQLGRPVAIILLFTAVLWSLLSFILKDGRKGGVIISLFLLLFFSYGHIHNALCSFSLVGFEIGRHRYLLPLGAAIFILGSLFLTKKHNRLLTVTGVFNIMSIVLLSMPLVTIASQQFKSFKQLPQAKAPKEMATEKLELRKGDYLPNIYYIILDGYAREDILRYIYSYDNSKFINYLSQIGFYVASKSRANYPYTFFSLPSSFNFRYLDGLVPGSEIKVVSHRNLKKLISDNCVVASLKQLGYRFVAFSSGFYITELKDADVYIVSGWFLDEFFNELVSLTPIPPVIEIISGFNREVGKYSQYSLHRQRIMHIFEHLPDTTRLKPPLFVFAHICVPHPPFVFDEDGKPVDPEERFAFLDGDDFLKMGGTSEEYREKYAQQITFVNKMLKKTIFEIISQSAKPPILILQADHGPRSMLSFKDPNKTNFRECMSIFNAYYLPKDGNEKLYPQISPVNTFRVIFNHYFGAKLPLLPDTSYFSTSNYPFNFVDVTEKVISTDTE